MRNKKYFIASVSLVLLSAIVFLTGCGNAENPEPVVETTAVQEETETVEFSDEVITEANKTEVPESVEQTDIKSAVTEETTAVPTPQTVEEIVAFFNESANIIKPNAKIVVKNYEKRIVNEDKLDIPDSLESTARTMMTTFMKDDTDPIVYETKEDIKNEFLVPGQSYVSVLKPEYVRSAVFTEKGNEYIIHIKLKDSKNPTAGNGVGSVCDVIETGEVAEKASFVKEFTTEYYNCEVIATVDKATGNVTHIKYITPVVLSLTVDMFGTHRGTVGFTFEKDYSITY